MTDGTGSSAIERSEQPPNVGLTLALVIALIGATAAYYLAPSELAPRITVLALAIFGVAGIFFLCAYAIGLIQFSGRVANNDPDEAHRRHVERGLLVARADGRIIYVNDAYRAMCDAKDFHRNTARRKAVLRTARSLGGDIDWRRRRGPASRTAEFAVVAAALRTGASAGMSRPSCADDRRPVLPVGCR
ncbi:MAG: hypothetical protein U1E25_12695 [Methylocystis sp.]